MVSKKIIINLYCPLISKDRICWFSAEVDWDHEPSQEELDYMRSEFWHQIVDNQLQTTYLWEDL